MSARLEFAPGIACQNDRKVIVGMPIGIGDTTSPNNHRVMKEGVAIDILGGLHLFQEIGQLLGIKSIDLGNFIHFVLSPTVMRETVMTFVEAEV